MPRTLRLYVLWFSIVFPISVIFIAFVIGDFSFISFHIQHTHSHLSFRCVLFHYSPWLQTHQCEIQFLYACRPKSSNSTYSYSLFGIETIKTISHPYSLYAFRLRHENRIIVCNRQTSYIAHIFYLQINIAKCTQFFSRTCAFYLLIPNTSFPRVSYPTTATVAIAPVNVYVCICESFIHFVVKHEISRFR